MNMFEEQEKFLIELRSNKMLIFVEGKKDHKVLKMVGLDNIVEISGKQLEKVADMANEKQLRVTILTDYDSEGVKQYKRLKSLLQANGIKVDDSIRRNFKRMFLVNKIEELSSYLK